jgi:hypothetical protein
MKPFPNGLHDQWPLAIGFFRRFTSMARRRGPSSDQIATMWHVTFADYGKREKNLRWSLRAVRDSIEPGSAHWKKGKDKMLR